MTIPVNRPNLPVIGKAGEKFRKTIVLWIESVDQGTNLKLILTMTVFELLRHKDRMRFQN